ncbi:MAG TPA: hypothetical protein VF306_16635 [Pirellulales bacterium]
MSTLHPDTSDAAGAQPPIVTTPLGRSPFEEALRDFEEAAQHFSIATPSSAELQELCQRAEAITRELFPGEFSVEARTDPEIPDDLYLVIEVRAAGSIDEIAALNDEWHGRVCRLPHRIPGLFRLSIDIE